MKFVKMLWAMVGSLFIVWLYATLSSVLVSPKTEWFLSLKIPVYFPASFIVSLIWCVIYGLDTFVLARIIYLRKPVWYSGMFSAGLVLNLIWLAVFFKGHVVFFSLILCFILLAYHVLLLILFFKMDKATFFVFLPVVLWYAFLAIVLDNLYIINLV